MRGLAGIGLSLLPHVTAHHTHSALGGDRKTQAKGTHRTCSAQYRSHECQLTVMMFTGRLG